MTTTKKPASKQRSTQKSKGQKVKTTERRNIPQSAALKVLTEAGYRCAVPTCRGMLAMDLHHLWQVCEGGQNDPANLIALCPTCHNLHHRGTIAAEALYVYKALLVSLSQAFDTEGIDLLLFLSSHGAKPLIISGDGVLTFARLIASDLAKFSLNANNNGLLVTYAVNLTQKGRNFIEVWKTGNRGEVQKLLGGDSASVKVFVKAAKSTRSLTEAKLLRRGVEHVKA